VRDLTVMLQAASARAALSMPTLSRAAPAAAGSALTTNEWR
jgi:hypothetical protein